MGILDPVTPKYYKPITLNMERADGDVVAVYNVAIYNVNANVMTHLPLGSTLMPEEKAVVAALYQRDIAQFEAATGLEPLPEEPEP